MGGEESGEEDCGAYSGLILRLRYCILDADLLD